VKGAGALDELDRAARLEVRAWLAHRAAREVLDAARSEAGVPIDDQTSVVSVFARLFDVVPIGSSGEWPNPFATAAEDPETRQARDEALPSLRRLAVLIKATATKLCGAGVPIDPESGGSLVNIAQLVLLPIDLKMTPAEIVAKLIVFPSGRLDRQGRVAGSSTTTERELRALHSLAALRPERASRRAGSLTTRSALIEAGVAAARAVDPTLTARGFLEHWGLGSKSEEAFRKKADSPQDDSTPDLKTLDVHWR
jgi:hypothetical protein